MADETFEIGFEVTNAQAPAQAFEDLKLKQLQAGEEAKRLSAELRALQQSGQATAQKTEELQRALIRAKEAAAQYGAQARQVAQAQRAQAQAAQAQASATNTTSTAMTRGTAALATAGRSASTVGQQFGQLSSSIGRVGSIIGTAAPALGGFVTSLGQAGGAMTGLSATMGPVGIAIGAVTAAIGIATAAWELFGDEAEEAGRDAEEAAGRATRSMTQVIEARITDTQVRIEQMRATAGSDAEFVEQTAVLRGLQAQLEELEAPLRLRAQLEEEATTRARAHAQAEAGLVEAAREYAAGLAELEEQEREQQRRREEAQQSRQRAAQSEREELARIDALADQRDQYERSIQKVVEALEREQAAFNALYGEDAMAAAEARANAFTQNRLNDSNEMLAMGEQIETDRQGAHQADLHQKEQDREKLEETKEHHREVAAITDEMWSSVGASVTDFAGQMFKFLISGSDKSGDAFLGMLDAFLEATAIEYSIKALGEAANAIAAFARNDYVAGPQHLIAAGMAAGVAAATGIAGAAINVPSAGAGGSAPASAGQAATAGGGGGVTNISINLFAPNAVFTEAERGQMLTNSMRATRREFGPAATRV